ncbi:protein turtle homolog B-like [Tachypleus tridentatus]|uniref:protein turtle homolog B-like n=1 Tax=Tachypleus tridentatus TaxID=6853 RepID=UPI003FD45809
MKRPKCETKGLEVLCFSICFMYPFVLSGVPGIKLKPVHVLDDQTEYVEYHSVVGDRVVLPCNITPPSSDDSVALVLWYKGSSGNPIYTVDARNEPVQEGKHFSTSILGSRAKFNISQKSSFLLIKQIKADDGGDYRCRVDFRRGRTQNRKLKVNVIVPPRELHVKTGEKQLQDTVLGPINEGNSLNLTCEARGGNPPPSVTWWKESVLLDDSFSLSKDNIVVNSLEIKTVERYLSKATITCKALNTNLTKPLSVSIKLNVNLKPQYVRISSSKRKLEAGRKQEMKCSTEGSLPAANITWWLDGKKMVNHRQTVTGDPPGTYSILTFLPTEKDNNKTLVCRVSNPYLPESVLEERWKLDVFYKPKLSLVLGANVQDEQIREGHDVYFECNIHANPQVQEVKWFFDDKSLFSEPSKGIIINNRLLRLQSVGKQHRGTYQCQAHNSIGMGYSEEVPLNIQYSPDCAPGQKTVYGVGRNERVRVACHLEADPIDIFFQWSFNNSQKYIDIVTFNSSGTMSSAYFIPKTKYDYGTLLCSGKNSIGEQRKPCVFTIIPAGKPEFVSNCSINNQTELSLIISCEEGDDGGLLQQFHLEVYSKKYHILLVNMTSLDHPVFEVVGLPSGSPLMIVVYASNAKGKSSKVTLTATTLFTAEKHIGSVAQVFISPILAVLLGIVLVLVIMALVILVIVKKRRYEVTRGETPLTDTDDKTDNHKVKNPEDRSETKDRCPDVIPPGNVPSEPEYTDIVLNVTTKPSDLANQCTYENLNKQREHTYENIISKPQYTSNKNNEELTYAELILPENNTNTIVKSVDPPTEYADIDFHKSSKLASSPGNETEEEDDSSSVETPLMNNRRDDKKWLQMELEKPTVSTPV